MRRSRLPSAAARCASMLLKRPLPSVSMNLKATTWRPSGDQDGNPPASKSTCSSPASPASLRWPSTLDQLKRPSFGCHAQPRWSSDCSRRSDPSARSVQRRSPSPEGPRALLTARTGRDVPLSGAGRGTPRWMAVKISRACSVDGEASGIATRGSPASAIRSISIVDPMVSASPQPPLRWPSPHHRRGPRSRHAQGGSR